ncbi:MAG: hypothetical protein WBA68_08560 [Alteraurantiacibacter sp.]
MKRYFLFVAMLTTLSASPASAQLYIDGVASEPERQSLDSLMQAAQTTLASDRFRTNLLSLSTDYQGIFARIDGIPPSHTRRDMTVVELADMLRSQQPFRYVRTPVSLIGAGNFYYALSGITGDGVSASFTLGRGNLANWMSPDTVQRSCAVNTVAHELSHLISSDPANFSQNTQPIRDRYAGNNSGTDAVASYLIGTAAQCTWLQEQNYTPTVDFRECVTVFGYRGFNGGRCTQFASGQAIEWRNGLYAEHVITD